MFRITKKAIDAFEQVFQECQMNDFFLRFYCEGIDSTGEIYTFNFDNQIFEDDIVKSYRGGKIRVVYKKKDILMFNNLEIDFCESGFLFKGQ